MKEQIRESMVPLDLVLDYPVEWEFWQVLRDLIQNFYDSIGYLNFYREFHYHYEHDAQGFLNLTMQTKNHPFSYEWLVYFGGSTKTGKEGFVGNYGEGFKICALNLVKMECSLSMESKNWHLTTCIYSKEIDGQDVQMLGYQIRERENDGLTLLRVGKIAGRYETDIKEALLQFFYPENPLFGKKITDMGDYAIYERSDALIPCRNRSVPELTGILYFRYLARGMLPFPLIILAKTQKCNSRNKRDRNTLLLHQVISVVYHVAESMTAEDSFWLLVSMKDYWAELPEINARNYFDVSTWYYVICQLVRNISKNKELSVQFRNEYPNLVYLDRISSDIILNRKIRAAKEWHRLTGQKEKIVNPIFRLLGIQSLLELHRQDLEQTVFEEPDQKQRALNMLIQRAYEDVIPRNLQNGDKLPDIKLSDNYKGSPMIFSKKIYGKSFGNGLHKKYQIETVIMASEDYKSDMFYETFIKYAQSRFRIFGTDRSEKMTILLTRLGAWMYDEKESLENIKNQWEEIANEH